MNPSAIRSTRQPTGRDEAADRARPRPYTPARWSAAAAVTYLTAWLIGLITGPAAPAPAASDAQIHTHYLTEPGVLMQSLLVHGIAGIALGALAVAIPTATAATRPLRYTIIGTGLAAALTSLLQAGFAVAAVTGAPTAEPGDSAGWFAAINTADTVKLMLLAGFVAAASTAVRRGRRTPRWFSALAAAPVVLLPFGAAAFLGHGPVLTALLYLSLPLLLLWVGATAFIISRRPAPTR